ncbi:MAG: hypothetical protein ACNS64_08645 [Candidatus Halalkalibacterium sp. M3_1C_030]
MISKPLRAVSACILTGIFVVLIASCNITGDDSFTETFIYSINRQSEIVSDTTSRQVGPDSTITVYTFSIELGSSLVFEYRRNVRAPENVTDAGLTETLVFQIPPGVDNFEFIDDELTEASTFYSRGCFCPESGAGFRVMDGFIEGESLSANIWFVRADVSISGYGREFDVTFEHIFRVSQ